MNEIFGGLGLNFVATALTICLIFGPWKRPGIGSMSGTEPFRRPLLAAAVRGHAAESRGRWSLPSPGSSLCIFLLQGTYFGLRLKAVGRNYRAAFLLGIPTWQYMMFAFLLCGALAGVAGPCR